MTTAIARGFLGALLCAAIGGAAGAEPVYDVCETQVRDDVRERFNAEILRIDFSWEYEGSSGLSGMRLSSGAVVYPANCNGYYYYEIFASYEVCVAIPHYGTPPNYIVFVSRNGACK